MKKKVFDFLVKGRSFKSEFKRQARLLIVVTFGFTIAFTWRQTFFDISQTFVKFLTHVESSTVSTILTSIFITLISVIVIYVTSYYLKDLPENY